MKAKTFFDFEYDNITPRVTKRIILLGGFIVLLFIVLIIFTRLNDDTVSLKYEDEIYMRVNKIRNYKGFLTLNDSLVISNNVKAIVKPQYLNNEVLIQYIGKPYLLTKQKNTYEFNVIDNQYTYTFKLFEDNGF